MKQIAYSARTLLVGDEVAQFLVLYATLIAKQGLADAVTFNALESNGSVVEATFILDNGANLMRQTSSSPHPEPNNDEAVAYLRSQLDRLLSPPPVESAGAWDTDEYFELDEM
ncbi:MAG: hypothetical protein ABWY54_07925 [Glaciihabitans sp.]